VRKNAGQDAATAKTAEKNRDFYPGLSVEKPEKPRLEATIIIMNQPLRAPRKGVRGQRHNHPPAKDADEKQNGRQPLPPQPESHSWSKPL